MNDGDFFFFSQGINMIPIGLNMTNKLQRYRQIILITIPIAQISNGYHLISTLHALEFQITSKSVLYILLVCYLLIVWCHLHFIYNYTLLYSDKPENLPVNDSLP